MLRAPSAARSGSAFACSCAVRWAARPAGLAVLSGCSRTRRASAPSEDICCCRSSSSALKRVTSRLRMRLPPPPLRSASVARDTDLIACARHQQGRIRLRQGQVETGLALLDETMIAVTAGQLVAPCHRLDVLQRDRRLSAGVRHGPLARVDRRPCALVRGAARYGRLRWRLPGAPRGNQAAAGCLVRGDRRGATRLRAVAGYQPARCRRSVLPAG